MTPTRLDKMAAYTMHIGKYYGKPLRDVPLEYLEWVVGGSCRGLSKTERRVIEEYIAQVGKGISNRP